MKQRVLIDLKINCEPPYIPVWQARTIEDRAKILDEWARDFNDFVRNHRSQDRVSLEVERIFGDQCSHCKHTWEVDADGPVCCGLAQDEWNAELAKDKA